MSRAATKDHYWGLSRHILIHHNPILSSLYSTVFFHRLQREHFALRVKLECECKKMEKKKNMMKLCVSTTVFMYFSGSVFLEYIGAKVLGMG